MKLVNSFVRGALLCGLAVAPVALLPVAEAASAPLVIRGTPATTAVLGQKYSFQPVATDSRPSRIVYDITNKPSWAVFDRTTGLLSGTPEGHVLGPTDKIWIRATDWYGFVWTPGFVINVVKSAANIPPTNKPPTIAGQPLKSINAGAVYSFKPSASDANHDSLTFSIRNEPTWATFNSSTGLLSGIADTAEVGTYANIVISVSDGKVSASLPPFSVAVNQMSSGNATLDWTPPTENDDGTALTDLGGYVVHYGQSASNLTQTIKLTNPGLSSYVVENLSAGTWYFAISSYTSGGIDGGPSGVVSTAIL